MKNQNTILWIIGIGILLLVVFSQSDLIKEQEDFSIKVHYYDINGDEIFPKAHISGEDTLSFGEAEVKENWFRNLLSSVGLFAIYTDCTPPSCNSGYTDEGISCGSTSCTRNCIKYECINPSTLYSGSGSRWLGEDYGIQTYLTKSATIYPGSYCYSITSSSSWSETSTGVGVQIGVGDKAKIGSSYKSDINYIGNHASTSTSATICSKPNSDYQISGCGLVKTNLGGSWSSSTSVSAFGQEYSFAWVDYNYIWKRYSLQQTLGDKTCQKVCSPDTCTSLGQTCGVWDDGCGGTVNCGSCCTSHSTYKCYSNDVYWYDSCNAREDKRTECGSDYYTGSNYCYLNDVYRDRVDNGCSGSSCFSNTIKVKQAECGALGCSGGVCNTCAPQTCVDVGSSCGTPGDGCGGTLSCGSCGTGLICQDNTQCIPEVAFISFEITVENTGEVDFLDVRIIDMQIENTMEHFRDDIDLEDRRRVNKYTNSKWYSNQISTRHEWIGSTTRFKVWIAGTNEYTGEEEIKTAYVDIVL